MDTSPVTAPLRTPTPPRRAALRAARPRPEVQVFVDPADGTRLVSIPDAAKLTGVQPRAVYRWIADGAVAVRKLAGSRRMRVVVESLWEPVG